MEDSKGCINIEIVAESSDNNNTQNSSLGDEDSLKKELFQTLYEIHSKELQIIEKAVDDSSAREAQLLSENERLKKKLEEIANPIDVEHNVPVLYQKPEDINEKLEDYKKYLVEKDKKIESLEKDRENLLKDSNRNQRLTFVHEILKKQKEEAVEKSAQQENIIINLQRKLREQTAQLEKNKEEVLNLPAERNDEGAEKTRKLLEDAKIENVELRAKNESLEKELTVLKDMKKSLEEKVATEAELKMLYEKSNHENNKLQSHNETLRNRLKEKDEALKTSKAEASDAFLRLKKYFKDMKGLQVTVKEQEVRLMKSQREVKNLTDDLRLREDEFEEEQRKLRELDDKYKTQTDCYHVEVRQLRAKIRNLETELDSIHHLERNSDHYNTDEQLEFPKITFKNDSKANSWETERLDENGRKRRREEYYSESEDEKPTRQSVFARLGRN